MDDPDSHYVSLSVPGNKLTALLPYLAPLTRYEVNIYAQYEKGNSLPATGYETTSESIQSLHSRHFFKLASDSSGSLTHSHCLQNAAPYRT